MSTYQEAMTELGVALSTVQRRLRITGVPTQIVKGRTTFDLPTLIDAWEQHVQAMKEERHGREKATEASISVSIPMSQRLQLERLAERHGSSLAAVVREVIEIGLEATA